MYWGNGVFDPSSGYNDLLKTPIGGSTITEIANSNQALPGDRTVNFHTRYHFPVTDGNTVYFVADETNYAGSCMTYTGIFSMSIKGGAFTDLVDSCATLPGITKSMEQNSFTSGSANQGTVVHSITDATGPSIHAIYSSATSQTARDRRCRTRLISRPGRAMSYGLFPASPACAPIDTPLVSITLGSLTYNPTTKIYSQTATITNTSSSNSTGPLSLLVTNLTAGTTMTNESGVTICEAPAGSPYINLTLAKNILPKTKSTSVTLQKPDHGQHYVYATSRRTGRAVRAAARVRTCPFHVRSRRRCPKSLRTHPLSLRSESRGSPHAGISLSGSASAFCASARKAAAATGRGRRTCAGTPVSAY